MKLFTCKTFVTLFLIFSFHILHAQKLAVVPYVSGINSPIDLKQCGDDRLFIADKGGFIRIINADGTLRPTPFLDISSKIYQGTTEQGIFGIAFSPNYKADGKFYVYYTANVASQVTIVVEEYKVSTADSNVADISSALTLLTQSAPTNNDLGGNLMFGKDGYLYINIGDGGSGDYGQMKSAFLGKILRLDISNSSTAQPYAIPASNPYYYDSTPGIKKEIWAIGVRNPFRSSFDKITGDLWTGDVGESRVEEIDFQPSTSAGGEDYGWYIMEGPECYNPSTGCNTAGLTFPVYSYLHPAGFAVIGGYVSRSVQSKSLFGTYIFGDFVGKWIDGIRQSGGAMTDTVSHLILASQATGNPISFGEDSYGDQYIIFNGDSTIYKLEDTSSMRRPKAYFTPANQGGGSYLLQGLQGRSITYQWLKDNSPVAGATSPDYTTSLSGNYTLEITNSLGFKDTSDVFLIGGVLPLQIVSFNAQKLPAGNIGLQWETASEQNISSFSILRKQNNESAFTPIGYVQSKSVNGVSNTTLDYSFTDSFALKNSKLFYRLQIRNIDGSVSYSDIRTLSSAANGISFSFYPNPAKGQVQVNISGFANTASMVIYDNAGRKVREQVLTQQSTNVELQGLKGIYIVQVSNTDGSNTMRKKLLVK